jgi:hypothetical protein
VYPPKLLLPLCPRAQLAHDAAAAAAERKRQGKGGSKDKKKHKALVGLALGAGAVPWSKAEEQVLCAVVNEFQVSPPN